MLVAHLPSILNGSIAQTLMKYYHKEAGGLMQALQESHL